MHVCVHAGTKEGCHVSICPAPPYSLETMNLKVSCHPASLLSVFSMAAGVTVKCLAMLSFLCGCWECELKAHTGRHLFPCWWYCLGWLESGTWLAEVDHRYGPGRLYVVLVLARPLVSDSARCEQAMLQAPAAKPPHGGLKL